MIFALIVVNIYLFHQETRRIPRSCLSEDFSNASERCRPQISEKIFPSDLDSPVAPAEGDNLPGFVPTGGDDLNLPFVPDSEPKDAVQDLTSTAKDKFSASGRG
jgi:hypothetical protein